MSSEDFAPIDFTEIESTQEKEQQDKFQQLYQLNLNDKVENKNGLTYLSWANAWAAFKMVYPNATYRIIKNPQTNLPYFADETGIMVYTEITADHQTYEMWLPVMDASNKAMKLEAYTYQVWDKTNRKYVDRKVEAATMFDINKTVMRCLVKNLAMFGLGLYILPEKICLNKRTMPPQQYRHRPLMHRSPEHGHASPSKLTAMPVFVLL